MNLTFRAPLWKWQSSNAPQAAAWHFITLPVEQADKLRFFTSESFTGIKKHKGWGSIRVNVRIGGSEWKTSIFPDKKSGSYLLPVKAEVRKAEKLIENDEIEVTLSFASL